MSSHHTLSRNVFLGYFFFVTATVQMSGGDSFKEPFTLSRLLPLRRFHISWYLGNAGRRASRSVSCAIHPPDSPRGRHRSHTTFCAPGPIAGDFAFYAARPL